MSDGFQQSGFEDPHNPYAVSASEPVSQSSDTSNLASRWARLGAAIVDGLTNIPLGIVFAIIVFAMFQDVQNPQDLEKQLEWMANPLAQIGIGVGSVVVVSLWHLILNGYFLATRGQTIGKMALGIKIVDAETGNLVPLWPLFFKRFLSIQALGLIPGIGGFVGLIDVLLIFRDNQKCLHDDFAGTIVVNA